MATRPAITHSSCLPRLTPLGIGFNESCTARLLGTSSSYLAPFSTSSKATASSLTDLLTGSYDPLSKKKDDGQSRLRKPKPESGQDQGSRPPYRAGQQARRQAVGLSQQRAWESRDRQPQQRRDGQYQQRQPGAGRGRGRGRGSGRSPAFTPGDAAESSIWEDLPDVGSEDISATTDRRPRSERTPRRKPASMMSTISDDSAVFSGRSGRGSGRGMQAGGRGRGDGRARGRGRGRGRAGSGADLPAQGRGPRQQAGPEGAAADEEEEAGEEGAAEGRVSHPEDGMGMDEEPDWHVALEDGTLATLPLDREGSTYMLDNDGVTVKELWESLDLTQLRELLQFELSYSRADHEAWLRGPGRAEMDAARREVGVEGFEDEQDFEEEVAMQMQMFDRFTWVDDLYFFYKRKEIEAGAAADGLRLEHVVAGLRARTAGAAAGDSPAPAAGDTGSADAPAEAAAGGEGEAGAEGAEAGGESEEPRELSAEEASEREAERHAWMKGDVRRSLREARMLAKLTAIRERAPIGTAPRRDGNEFNRREFETLLTDKMMDLVFPERPRALDGSHMSERQAEDAQRSMFFEAHPETDVSLERPELFPASTQEQLSWEFFERRMDLLREEICHPLAGIYTDEDWAAFKEVVYDKVPELMEKRFKMHSDQGFSGLLGGFQEEQLFLNGIGSNVMPESHIARPMLAIMTHRIANNPQWKWQEKVRAVHKLAHLLLRGERHARQTTGTTETASPS